jgi:hypothetical protein
MKKKIAETAAKSEQIDDIIEKMPLKFGVWVTGIVLLLIFLLFFFGWVIEYPDTVTGSIVIQSKYAPVKLVANSSGKLTLFRFRQRDYLKSGDYIAVIQNSANTADVLNVERLLNKFDFNHPELSGFIAFPKNASLGEINIKYYNFLTALKKRYDYDHGNLFQKQEIGYSKKISQLSDLQKNNEILKVTRKNNMDLYYKMFYRDSILLAKGSGTEVEFDHSKLSYLTSKENFQSISNDLNNTQQLIDENQNKLQQLNIQRDDEESKMKLDLLTAYADLKDNISGWEQRYAFKAPLNGKLDFARFWNDNEFIGAGEDAFIIVPEINKIVGQVHLPSQGAGKVKTGQNVVIKLENYPYEEYGIVNGLVSSISLSTNELKESNQNIINSYLVEIKLPDELTTNYGVHLDFKSEIRGTVEIICNERNLLSRFFDNLKHSTTKE